MPVNRTWIQRVVCTLACFCLLACQRAAVGQEPVEDSIGTRYRPILGGRFVQGMSGGERMLRKSFPLSTTGQFYGNAEDPAHVTWVTKPFYIAETEVTVAQFRQFVAATGHKTSAENGETTMVGWDPTPDSKPLYQSYDFLRAEKFDWRNPGFRQGDQHPVVGISHADARAFCEWLSRKDGIPYRLPTEAEWEFACRAGGQTWFSFGDQAQGVFHRFANLGGVELEKHRKHSAERQWLLEWDVAPSDGHIFTAPVRSYQPNAWNLHDMHGNVWEWCDDLWLDTVYKDYVRPQYNKPSKVAIDPVNTDRPQTATNDFRAIRGGSWYNGDLPCRSSNRTYWDSEDAACYIGFRMVRDAGSALPNTAAQNLAREQQAIAQIEAAGGELLSSRGLDIEVVFSGNQFDESALKALQHLPDLKRLRIAWRVSNDTNLSQSGIDLISKLRQLESLDFSTAFRPDDVDLSALTRLTKLEVLRFPRSGPVQDRHLLALGAMTSLREFQCYGTAGGLTDTGIAALRGNQALEVLHVDENEAVGDFLADFVGCPLRSFRCTAPYGREGTLTDAGAAHLAGFPTLRSVVLERQPALSGRALKAVAQLEQLETLKLEGCPEINDEDFAVLATFSKMQELSLIRTGSGDVAATAISQIPRLRELRMASDTLSDEGVAAISQAFSIQELHLDSPQITDRGLEALGRINRIRRLVVRSGQVNGSGLGPICELPNLDDLSLITVNLTDIAFGHLCRSRSLRKLRLAHRGEQPPKALTNSGMMKLNSATWLKEIWLPRNDTGMTESKMKELQSQMPKTNVIPYTVDWK